MAELFRLPFVQALDSDGNPISGATLTFYRSGTSTLASIYTDNTLDTLQANPITANAAGRFAPIYLDSTTTYRAVLKDAGGATISDVDPVTLGGGTLVTAFGADPTGVADSTAAFNLATGAADAWSTALYYGVSVSSGFYKIGGGNTSVTVRKGQSLTGAGFGSTTIDASTFGTNTVPTIRGASGDTLSGYPVEVGNMLFLGGPSGFANIEMTGFAGWKVRDVFFSAPGVGVLAGGGDGQVQNCIFDLGLNHIFVTGGNLMISGNIHYLGSYHVTLATACYDTTITNGQYEYFEYAAILVSGGVGPKNVAIDNSNFIQNGQFVTTQGGVFIISNNCDIALTNNRFRNINGYAIKYGSGVGNRMLVNGFIIDQEKTLPVYVQGVNMGGIDCTNMDATICNGVMRNMQQNSILVGGAEVVNVIIDAVRFENCVGGAADIVITNSNPASRVFIKNCHSSRALVSVTGAAVVNVSDCTDSATGVIASAAALTIPKTRDTFFVTGTTNITSIVADAGNKNRTIRLIFQGVLTVSNTGVSTFLAGGVNFATTANDVLTLTTADGTAWFETGRSLN